MNINRILGAAGGAALAAGIVAVAAPAGAASGPSADVDGDTLRVEGSGADDKIAFTFFAGSVTTTVRIDFGADGSFEEVFDVTTFSRLDVDSKGGSDKITFTDPSANARNETITLDGGSGDDEIMGSVGDDTIDGGSGNDSILANLGVDTIDSGSGDDTIIGGDGNDTATMGSGADVFVWNPGDDNDIVDGDSGRDTHEFNGNGAAEKMRLVAEGGKAVFLRDVANVRMDLDDVERLDLAAFGGIDAVTIGDMSGTDMRTADVDLAVDGAADTVEVDGTARGDEVDVEPDGTVIEVLGLPAVTRIAGSDAALDRLQVNTGEGNDDVDFDSRVLTLIQVLTDLGPGQA